MAVITQTIGRARYVVPSAFTAASAACAVMSMQSPYLPADPAWWILCSVLLDKLDGTAARLLHAETAIGVQFDSIADLIAFGIAPAHLFYRLACAGPLVFPGSDLLWALIAVVYAAATAWRLHRFNREASGAQAHCFRGMPSTLAGGLFAAYVVTFMPDGGTLDFAVLTLLMLILSMAMNLNYRSNKITIPKRRDFLVLQASFVLFVYYATFTRQYPPLVFLSSLVALAFSTWGARRDVHDERSSPGV